jgi:hypothetical protein
LILSCIQNHILISDLPDKLSLNTIREISDFWELNRNFPEITGFIKLN